MGAFATVSVGEGCLEEKENPFNGRPRGPRGFERGAALPLFLFCVPPVWIYHFKAFAQKPVRRRRFTVFLGLVVLCSWTVNDRFDP